MTKMCLRGEGTGCRSRTTRVDEGRKAGRTDAGDALEALGIVGFADREHRREAGDAPEVAWVGQGGVDVTSNSESLSDQFCQKTRSPYETLRRDEHLGPNEMSF